MQPLAKHIRAGAFVGACLFSAACANAAVISLLDPFDNGTLPLSQSELVTAQGNSNADQAVALAIAGVASNDQLLFEATTRVVAAALRPGAENFLTLACVLEAPARRPEKPIVWAATTITDKPMRCRRQLI